MIALLNKILTKNIKKFALKSYVNIQCKWIFFQIFCIITPTLKRSQKFCLYISYMTKWKFTSLVQVILLSKYGIKYLVLNEIKNSSVRYCA